METSIENKVFEVLYNGNLVWQVQKEQLYTDDKTLTPGWCTRRSDNGSILGIVGSRYMPLQNQQLVREFIEATEGFGLTKITGTAVNDGKKIVLKARIGDITIGTDVVHRYITASNTHDGSAQVRLGMYNMVQVCSNGMMRELTGHQLAMVKHTTNAADKMNWYIRNLPKVIALEEQMMQDYQRLSEVRVNKKHIEGIVKALYNTELKADPETVSARRKAQVEKFGKAVKENGLNVHGETLWGLLNASTWINSRDTRGKVSVDRQMTGRSQELSELTYSTLMSMIGNSEYDLVEA